MKTISYTHAATAEAAVQGARLYPRAAFLAGGTTLVDLLREEVLGPEVVIDINDLPLREIRIGHDTTEIGALVANSDLAWHRAFRLLFPVVSQALLAGASPQIRNMATVGGNLLQRTRCPYYRDNTQGCNKRTPGSGCSALEGFNRSHAILGGSDFCVATHPSDFAVALMALEPTVQILGSNGMREIPFSTLHRRPEATPEKEFNLSPEDLIVRVKIPHTLAGKPSVYLKVRDRQSYEFALASAAVVVEIESTKIKNARIALGGIATVPWRSVEAENVLIGQVPSEALFQKAAEMALRTAKPLKHNAFKVELAKRTLMQALQTVSRTA